MPDMLAVYAGIYQYLLHVRLTSIDSTVSFMNLIYRNEMIIQIYNFFIAIQLVCYGFKLLSE